MTRSAVARSGNRGLAAVTRPRNGCFAAGRFNAAAATADARGAAFVVICGNAWQSTTRSERAGETKESTHTNPTSAVTTGRVCGFDDVRSKAFASHSQNPP